MLRVDVAIVGLGSAGLSAWRAAAHHTDKLLAIDPGPDGTTCARVGCMPSKLLIAAADTAHHAREAHRFGIDVPTLAVDGRRVMARVRSERDRFVNGVLEEVDAVPAAQRLRARARFLAPQVLQAGDTRVEAGRIVLATGSAPRVPPAWRTALGDRLIVNDDVFDWTDLPRSVAVVGSGAIGLELAQALHRLGVRVRLFGRDAAIGPLGDPALLALARDHFAQALPLSLNAKLHTVERLDDGEGGAVRLGWTAPDGEHEERFDFLLAAMGRVPRLAELDLARSGLPLDDEGVPRFDRHTMQVGDTPVFMAGDAADDRPLLHEAADEGRIAGHNAGAWPKVLAQPRRAPLAIVFSDPQIALCGASHRALLAEGRPFATGRVSFANQGRSRVIGANVGALHVYGDPATRRVLGAEMVGPTAEHLGHLLAWSVQRGDTVEGLLEMPYYHPVIEEGLRSALRDLRRALQQQQPASCEGCTPGE